MNDWWYNLSDGKRICTIVVSTILFGEILVAISIGIAHNNLIAGIGGGLIVAGLTIALSSIFYIQL